MTLAVVVLAATCAVLAAMLVLTLRQLGVFLREWSTERRALIDRVMAKDIGEVIALDRSARRSTRNENPEPPKLVEGLT